MLKVKRFIVNYRVIIQLLFLSFLCILLISSCSADSVIQFLGDSEIDMNKVTPSSTENTITESTPITLTNPNAEPAIKYNPTPEPTANPTKEPTPRPSPSEKPDSDLLLTNIEAAKQILPEIIREDMKDIEKIHAVHDYIVLNTKYDYDNLMNNSIPKISYTAEGVIQKGVAVCQGYADAFQIFMELLEIDSKVVVGTDLNNGVGHAWNMVSLDGNWYHIDTTWNDPVPDQEGIVQYKYFMVSDQVLATDHEWERKDYPICDSVDYQYYIYQDYMIASITQYEEKFMEQYDAGERTITVLYPEKIMPDFEFFQNYDYLWKFENGKYTISKTWYPPWRLGDYTVLTVIVD